ncbi:type II secretion system secretin GspD [Endozoicomonadaceae bacterium StTr2]
MKNILEILGFNKSRLAAVCCLAPVIMMTFPVTGSASRTPEGVTPAGDGAVAAEHRRWTINQQNSDIREFINQVAAITGETFILDPRIKGGNTVTVISSKPMTREQVYDVFLEVLNANGYTVIPKGKVMNIIPNTVAKTASADNGPQPPRDATMVTRVIELHSVSSVEVIPIIRPLIAQYGHAAASASSNSIIVSDVADNVDRIQRLVEELDSASNNDYEVIQLKHAWVGDVAKILQETLNTGKGQLPSGLQVIADERSNRLVVKGNASKRARVRKLAETLDQEGIRKSSTRVVFLRYAEAKNLAEILTEASQSIKDAADAKAPATGRTPTRKSRAPAPPTAKGPATTQGKGLGDVFIKADESQNALIMIADPETLQELETLVRQLDIRRAQVLIEAAIVEISGTVDDALGIQWGIDGKNTGLTGSTGGEGNTSSGLKRSVTGNIFDNSKINIGTVALRNSNFGVLVTALSQKSNANLLSTPSLMTLDNQEAELLVGEEVPFRTGSYTTSSGGGSDNPFTTVDRKDVGIKLKVTPHINDGNIMRLEIEQEISSLSSNQAASDLITNKRQLKTVVLIDDGETVVLGGLLRDDLTKSQSRVPFLSAIPGLGELFKYNNDKREKRNLMLFIRPTIVRDSSRMAELTQDKYTSIKIIKPSDSSEAKPVLPSKADQLFLPPAIDLRQKPENDSTVEPEQPDPKPVAAPAA